LRNYARADNSHRRIQPHPAEKLSSGQSNNGEHRSNRVGNDVNVCGAKVEVVMVLVSVGVPVAVSMTMRAAQHPRADHIDAQTDTRNDDRFVEMNFNRMNKTIDRFDGHVNGNRPENNRAGKRAKHRDFACAKTELGITRMAACEKVRAYSDQKRCDMRTHVAAIGEESHRMEFQAADDFDDHHHQRQQQHAARALLGQFKFTDELVMVLPFGNVAMHDLLERKMQRERHSADQNNPADKIRQHQRFMVPQNLAENRVSRQVNKAAAGIG
jgi:hypothetical protein